MVRRGLLALALLTTVDSVHASADVASSPSCVLSGKLAFSATLYSAATGGLPLATLSYTPRRVEVSELPADSVAGRAKIDARRDTPSIHFVGWVSADALQLTTKADVTIVPDHVWLRAGAPLKVTHPKPSELVVEARDPSFAKLRAPVACADLALGTDGPVAAPTTPSKEFVFKAKSTPLFDAPGGKPVFTLEPVGPLASFVVEIRESQGAFHHFRFVANEKIDGWLRASDLAPRKHDPGEEFGAGGLGLSGIGGGVVPTTMVATRDTTVYLDAAKTATVVGTLEKGAKVRVVQSAPAFSTFTLFDGDARAPTGKSFHVLTADLKPAP